MMSFEFEERSEKSQCEEAYRKAIAVRIRYLAFCYIKTNRQKSTETHNPVSIAKVTRDPYPFLPPRYDSASSGVS